MALTCENTINNDLYQFHIVLEGGYLSWEKYASGSEAIKAEIWGQIYISASLSLFFL